MEQRQNRRILTDGIVSMLDYIPFGLLKTIYDLLKYLVDVDDTE